MVDFCAWRFVSSSQVPASPAVRAGVGAPPGLGRASRRTRDGRPRANAIHRWRLPVSPLDPTVGGNRRLAGYRQSRESRDYSIDAERIDPGCSGDLRSQALRFDVKTIVSRCCTILSGSYGDTAKRSKARPDPVTVYLHIG